MCFRVNFAKFLRALFYRTLLGDCLKIIIIAYFLTGIFTSFIYLNTAARFEKTHLNIHYPVKNRKIFDLGTLILPFINFKYSSALEFLNALG